MRISDLLNIEKKAYKIKNIRSKNEIDDPDGNDDGDHGHAEGGVIDRPVAPCSPPAAQGSGMILTSSSSNNGISTTRRVAS